MRVTDAVTDRIRQRREKLERAGVLRPDLVCAPQSLYLWQVDLDGIIAPANEHAGIAGIDLVAIPTGKFLQEDFGTTRQLPWVDNVRMFAHLPDVPPQTPTVPSLIDAPENPIPAPPHSADVEVIPEASLDLLRPKGIELDRDAVLIDLEKARAARKPKTREEKLAELREQMDKEFEQKRLAQRDAQPKPATMFAFAPQWTPERHGR